MFVTPPLLICLTYNVDVFNLAKYILPPQLAMVNDDLLKVKIDVQKETQETFMRRVKVRPFTFPPLLSSMKSKSEK